MVVVELQVIIKFDNFTNKKRKFFTTYNFLKDKIKHFFETYEYDYGEWLQGKIHNLVELCENNYKTDDLMIMSEQGFHFFKHIVNVYTTGENIMDHKKIHTIKIIPKKVSTIGGDDEWW